MTENVTHPLAMLAARHDRSTRDLQAEYNLLMLRSRNGALGTQPGAIIALLTKSNDTKRPILDAMRRNEGELEEQFVELIAINEATIQALKELS